MIPVILGFGSLPFHGGRTDDLPNQPIFPNPVKLFQMLFKEFELERLFAGEEGALHGPIDAVFLLGDDIFKTAREVATRSVILAGHRKL